MSLLLGIPLLMMALEDFRYRAIHWAWLAILSAGILWCFPFDQHLLLLNLLLVCFQLLVLTLFFSIKHGRLVYLPKQHLGWGDILFFVPLCLLFSPGNLVVFLIVSLVLGIIGFVIWQVVFGKKSETVPLAGVFSICLMAALVVHKWLGYDLRNDGALVNQIRGFLQNRI